MLKLIPSQRISAQEILDNHIIDFSKTLVKSNSNPNLLKTIKAPRDMLRLKSMLPEKRYNNKQKINDKFPEFKHKNISIMDDINEINIKKTK